MDKRFSILAVVFAIGLFIAGFVLVNQDPNGSKTINNNDNVQTQPYIAPSLNPVIYEDHLDGANDTNALKSRGYKVWYRGTGPQGLSATWYQGQSSVFNAFEGPATGYVAANYNVVTGANNIDSWLVLPYIPGGLQVGDSLYFYERSPSPNPFPDSMRVMVSASDSVPEGTWVELGRFLCESSGSWGHKGYMSTVSGSHARFAIRYNVVNGGPSGQNSNFVGIDYIQVVRSGSPPVSNHCLLFPTPGVNTNYVMIPYQSGMTGFNTVTMEGWVKIGGSSTPNTILNKGGSSFDYQLGINSSTTNPFFRAQSTVVIASTVSVTVGQWTHLAVTSDGSSVKFYKNGVLAYSSTTAATLGSSANEMRIGRGGNDPASGNIDEVRLWNITRTEAQISSDMCNKWVSNTATGLIGKWHFDNNLVDSVHGWNGTISGNVGYDTVTWCPITGIQQITTTVPKEYVLEQNYPNPFNPTTTIKFSIPKEGYVEMKLFDVTGKEVATLVSNPYRAGEYSVDFDASKLSSGVYFYRIIAGDFISTKKMVLLK